jgi:hypothetical protein
MTDGVEGAQVVATGPARGSRVRGVEGHQVLALNHGRELLGRDPVADVVRMHPVRPHQREADLAVLIEEIHH